MFALFRYGEGTASIRSDLRQHAALIKRAFQDVSPEEQRKMEEVHDQYTTIVRLKPS